MRVLASRRITPGGLQLFWGEGLGLWLVALSSDPRCQFARSVTHRTVADPHLWRSVWSSLPLPSCEGLRLEAEHLGGLLAGQQPVVDCVHVEALSVSCSSHAVHAERRACDEINLLALNDDWNETPGGFVVRFDKPKGLSGVADQSHFLVDPVYDPSDLSVGHFEFLGDPQIPNGFLR